MKLRIVLVTLAACAAFALAAVLAVVSFGLYNVSAQAGHWAVTRWALHTTFRNSVRLRAPPRDEVPDLADADLIALGAGHYATACSPCHAAPGKQLPATIHGMEPEPPPIAEAIAGWRPNDLHWIVENGVKMTGMPAWPAGQRGDEVWAVVAYLEAIRRGDQPELPAPKARDGAPEQASFCATCHDAIAGPVPRLDLQDADYLAAQMEAYLTGARRSGIMRQAISLAPPDSFPDLAAYLADAVPENAGRAAPAAPDPATERLASRGTRDVPACTACHGPGRKRVAEEGKPDFPRLAGQNRTFLATQLRLWRDGVLAGSSPLMAAAARDLTDAQIVRLATWYAALPAEEED